MGSFTTEKDEVEIDVLSSKVTSVPTSVFARNVHFHFIVSGSERTYTIRVLLRWLDSQNSLEILCLYD